ncbi:MAG: HD domain-containing protein, partial [Solirubrobacteraceae bacterium]|nr:HD domain-containing protein [Solirubrobacteraceae bacterium]
GRDFLKVSFADRTGVLQSVVWDDVDEIDALLVAGQPFRVGGQFEIHEKFGPQLKLEGFSPAVEGSYDPNDLRPGPPVPVPELEARLRALIATVTDPGMSAVLEAVLGEGTETWRRYREAPAAKRVHQAYRHGLLEHCLTVAEAVSAAAGIFPGIDRDLAVTAALIHDIGKLDAYAFADGDVVELTDAGKLRGEIVIGYERMHGVLNGIPGITEVRKQAFLHIVLAHHGKLEHGSPVTPQTREAYLVHSMDNLGGKLGTVDRMEQERQPGAAWSSADWAFGGSVWFADVAEEQDAEGASAAGAGWLSHPGLAPQGPPTLHGAPAFTEPEPPAVPPAPVDPVVPRGAFEDSPAWNPPEPESLTGPPLPGDGPLSPVPDHSDEPLPVAVRDDEHPPAATHGAAPTSVAPARDADVPSHAPAGAPDGPVGERALDRSHAPAGAPDGLTGEGDQAAADAQAQAEEAGRLKEAERAATAAQRAAAFDTPGRPTPERAEDEFVTASPEQRRGGPPPPPDVQPLPF